MCHVLAAIQVAVRLYYFLKGVKMEGFSLRGMMFIIVNNSALSFVSLGVKVRIIGTIKS
jgi:heme/copper-type cytochrome/quinol oxidase subunit 4